MISIKKKKGSRRKVKKQLLFTLSIRFLFFLFISEEDILFGGSFEWNGINGWEWGWEMSPKMGERNDLSCAQWMGEMMEWKWKKGEKWREEGKEVFEWEGGQELKKSHRELFAIFGVILEMRSHGGSGNVLGVAGIWNPGRNE